MKYAFALAALAGIAAAQPHMGHQRLHKKAAMKTVTDLTVVTVTDVVTVYGPSPAPGPTQPAEPSAAPPASSQAPASSTPAAAAAPPAQSLSDQPKAADASAPSSSPLAPASTPASSPAPPAASTPAPAQSSSAPSGGSSSGGGGSGVGNYGIMPGATAPADCTEDKPCQEGMTTYTTGLGACGFDDSAPNDQDVVALQKDMFGSVTNTGPNAPANKLCNKKIQITNPATGATAVGVIRDRCVGCTGSGGIDLSPPLWAKLNNNQPGNRLPVEWYFLD